MKSIDNNEKIQTDLLQDDTIIIIGIAALLLIGLILIISRCKTLIHSNKKVYRVYMMIRRKIFHNSIIRYFYTGAIKL